MAKPAPAHPPAAPAEHAVPTIDMVASAAGVSPSTVSRFLNGTAKVSAGKSAAISRAISELGFVANPVASGLAGGRSRCIGVITQSLSSPFYGNGLAGIEEVLIAANYAPLFASGHWSAKDESRCIRSLQSRRVDGLIILTPRLADADLLDWARHVPIVVTGRSLAAARLCSLDFDNELGARLATEHLIGLGHRRIAFIKGIASHPDSMQRLRGYKAALQAAGIAFDPALAVPGQLVEASGEQAVGRLVDGGVQFSAILAANDQMAYGAALALHRRGLRVPDDVSLVGFDDLVSSSFTLPPLTTVHHGIHEIGQLAARALLALIRGEAAHAQVPLPRLVIRDSTAPPARRSHARRHASSD